MFKEWKEDTDQTITEAIEHDLRLWKCARFIKSEEDLASLEDLMKDKADLLKNLFIQVASRGSFPYVGWSAFSTFCIKAGIPDKKGCPLATIDRVFITVD